MLKRLTQLLKITLACLLLIGLLTPEWPRFGENDFQILSRVGLRQFDFVGWWVNTVIEKRSTALASNHRFIETEEAKEIVLEFVEKTGEIRSLERQLSAVFSDPSLADPEEASAELQAEIAEKRGTLTDLQSLAEPILQEQITDVLIDFGFGSGGTVFPPVRAHVTPLPSVLIVSPRDQITQSNAVPMRSGILAPERQNLEDGIYDDLDLSAYVTNIGGLGFYPSMIIESSSLTFLVEVIAHEWAHHWFTLRPVGINYLSSPEMRTINESAANIVGKEVGNEVLRRFYPEFAPPPPEPTPTPDPNPKPTATPDPNPRPTPTPDPNQFDFRREMGVTRVEVDRLLAEGKVDEAEAYMEERRKVFVSQGYALRVLNQAYFSFHGAYADVGGGAAGRDPVGPLVNDLRTAAGSLKSFMQALSPVTSLAELESVAGEYGIFPE